ncbi:MAG TPA: hypothetical protein VNA69_18635 [Thermoanaerobaculia bacterium]|nr:hypothetical protein [Thermoanaerobaculia bacterium]
MSATIDKAQNVLGQLEAGSEADAVTALRELIAFSEGLSEDLQDYNVNVGRAAAAIGAAGCPVDQLHAIVRYVERVAPYFRHVPASGELIEPKRDEGGLLPSILIGPIEIRRNADGSLDEVVATNVNVHVEQMAENAWWVGVSAADDSHLVHVNFYSDSRIDAEAEDQHVHER